MRLLLVCGIALPLRAFDGVVRLFHSFLYLRNALYLSPSVVPMQTDLNRLFIPPEELIYGSNAIDRAALQRLRDIAQFSDDKTVAMAKKYM
jgi:hypothetical protein